MVRCFSLLMHLRVIKRRKRYLPFYPLVPVFSVKYRCFLSYCICPSTRPLWLSPRQVMLVPVNPSCEDYAKKVSVSFPHRPHVGMITFLSDIELCFRLLYIVMFLSPPPQVCKQFTEAGFMADADLDSSCLLNKKIRNAQLAQYNFILGEKLKYYLTSDSGGFLPQHCQLYTLPVTSIKVYQVTSATFSLM